jgi:hypothetical protein
MNQSYAMNEDMDYIEKSKKQTSRALFLIIGVIVLLALTYWYKTMHQKSAGNDQGAMPNSSTEIKTDGYAGFQAPRVEDFKNMPVAPQAPKK